jgi:GMP synthase-like glutamine amidotransferase
MKIGILQTGRSPDQLVKEFGDYGDMFQNMLADRGFTFQVYDVLTNEFPASPTEQDGWIITGSRYGAYEDHDWIPPLEDLVRAIHAAKRPLIGVCFGHQIIAQALGGKVEKFAGGWSVGRVEYNLADGGTLPLFAWHQDQVTELPPGAKTVASTDFCAHAAMTIGEHIYTIQPHPEFEPGFVVGLAETRAKGVVPDPQRLAAIDSTKTPVAKNAVADQFETFLKGARSNG